MIEIDGARFSGSGTIVRQSVAYAALTGRAVRIVNARAGRPNPGLRPQHVRVVEAIARLVGGATEGLAPGSMELVFRPGALAVGRQYTWDIGSAGSTTMLALAIAPVLAFGGSVVRVELRGGLFQDFAPSAFHLQHVVLPLLARMGLAMSVEIVRPGYVPKGDGVLALTVTPTRAPLQALWLEEAGPVERVWGIALASHLVERRVARRLAETAQAELARVGYRAEVERREDTAAPQPGAALALFADRGGGVRLGADQAGAIGRPAEAIGRHVARQIIEALRSGATLDRFAADQIIPFAALAEGESRFCIGEPTDHVLTNAWLAQIFLGAAVTVQDGWLSVTGVGFHPAGHG
ncbi:RNA 3'-terminal phosphate cyclase [Nitrospira sp. Kam-Ns4a]